MSLARAPQCHSSWQIAQHSSSSLISARTVRWTATWTGYWLTNELPAVQTQAGAVWKVSLIHQSPFNPPTPAVAPQQRERPLVCHTSVTQLGQMCVRACVYTWPCAPVFATPASTANEFSAENLLAADAGSHTAFFIIEVKLVPHSPWKQENQFYPFPISSSYPYHLTHDHVDVWVALILAASVFDWMALRSNQHFKARATRYCTQFGIMILPKKKEAKC